MRRDEDIKTKANFLTAKIFLKNFRKSKNSQDKIS